MPTLVTAYNVQWTEYDGATVTLDSLKCRLIVRDFQARFPYPARMLTVYAEAISKTSKAYRAMRAQLGDDWSADVLGSDPEVTADVMRQVGWRL